MAGNSGETTRSRSFIQGRAAFPGDGEARQDDVDAIGIYAFPGSVLQTERVGFGGIAFRVWRGVFGLGCAHTSHGEFCRATKRGGVIRQGGELHIGLAEGLKCIPGGAINIRSGTDLDLSAGLQGQDIRGVHQQIIVSVNDLEPGAVDIDQPGVSGECFVSPVSRGIFVQGQLFEQAGRCDGAFDGRLCRGRCVIVVCNALRKLRPRN